MRRIAGLDKGKVSLVLLSEVQLQHGVQAVEDRSELALVVFVRRAVDIVEHTAEPPEETSDFDVRTAHRRCRVRTTEDASEHGVELGLLGLLVGRELGDKE